MTESERLAIIANAVAQGDNKLDPSLANYMEDLKAEKLAEDLVIEHGLLEANQNDLFGLQFALPDLLDQVRNDFRSALHLHEDFPVLRDGG